MGRKPTPPLMTVLPLPTDLDARQRAVWQQEFDSAGLGHFTAADLPAMRTHVALVIEADDAYARMLAAEFARTESAHYRAMLGLVLASRRMLRMVPSARLSKQRAATLATSATTAGRDADWRALFPEALNPHRRA